jgi:simple sugar transport system substrate-binding protein
MKKTPVLAILAALALAGCSQSSTSTGTAVSTTPSSTATAKAPGKFGTGGVHIALVRQLSSGDYFEQWLAGAQAEAKELKVTLDVSSGDGNNDKQALNLQTAINNKADAIIVDHGFAQTIQPAISKAVAANIPVVAFDADPPKDAPAGKVVTLDQDDHQIAGQSLGRLKQDTGGTAKTIYVYVAGFAPLDRRNETWEQFKKDNPGITQVAKIGVVNSSTASAVADQAKAALQAHPDVTAIFAPYDEFAKGAALAVKELGLQNKVKIYGADVSTADIGVITQPNSPWVATSATDPANVGRVAVRAAALKVAGLPVSDALQVPPALITQQDLRARSIVNVQQLATAVPALETANVAPIPWATGR